MTPTTNDQGILPATDLINCISRNEPIKPINGVIVEGNIELNSVKYEHKLVVRNTTFRGHFDVSEAHFSRTLDLSGCIFEQNVNFCDVQIERNLVLAEAKIKASNKKEENLGNFERVHVQGWINAKALEAEVKLNFNHSHIGKLTLCPLQIKETIKQTICKEDVSLIGARILHQFDCSGVKIAKELVLQGIDIQGDFFCNTEHGYCTEIDKGIFMVGAKILGRVDFSGAKIGGDLNLELAEIQGALDFKPEWDEKNNQWHRTEINGDINLGGSKISPSIIFNGAKIHGDIDIQISDIKGNIFCNPYEYKDNPTEITEIGGKVNCSGAQITGSVHFNGTKIGKDIDFKGANIKGNICCRSSDNYRTEIEGSVIFVEVEVLGAIDFSGAKISGDIDLKRATIKSKLDCEMIGINRTEIGRHFNLAGAKVTGSVNLIAAKVSKDIVFKGVEILGSIHCSSSDKEDKHHTEIGGKLNLKRAQISSSVDLKKAKIQGILELKGAEIGNQFLCNLSNINLGNSKDPEANFQECTIHSLIVELMDENEINTPHKNAKLNLDYTRVIKLEIQGYLPKKGLIDLEGFEFKQLKLPDVEGNKYIQFLDATSKFNVSTYLFMENWLQNQGAQIDAKYVYIEMRRRNTREKISEDIREKNRSEDKWTISRWLVSLKPTRIAKKKTGKSTQIELWQVIKILWRFFVILWTVFVRKVYDNILDFTIRYGTATDQLFFFYFLPVLMSSWLLFNNPKSVELDWTATGSDLNSPQLIEGKIRRVNPTDKDWTSTDAFWLAVKISLPVIQFPSTDKWVPSSQRIQPESIMFFTKKLNLISYDAYAKFITLFSWFTLPLFLAGISGIVRKR